MKKTSLLLVLFISIIIIFEAQSRIKYTRLLYSETYSVSSHNFLKKVTTRKRHASSEKLFKLGTAQQRNGKYKEASNELKNALLNNPSLTVAFKSYYSIGICYREMNKYDWSIKCLKNAEGLLSRNRGELFTVETDDFGSFHKNLASLYREMSLTYLKWNKYASAIVYLWQSRRIGGDAYSLQDTGRLTPVTDEHQKKLLTYPLYKFLIKKTSIPGVKSARTRYFRNITETDPGLNHLRSKSLLSQHFFLKPKPSSEIKKPASMGNIYRVQYNAGGTVIRIIYNDSSDSDFAEDFDKSLYYKNGLPVSSLLESHTYNYVYCKVDYGTGGDLKKLCFITIPTQVGHYGFMPSVALYVF